MFARVTIGQVQTDRLDEATQVAQETFVPAAREQAGYQGFVLLADRAGQQVIGISFWESEAQMAATGGQGGYYREQMTRFAGLLTQPASTSVYDVVVREP
jgi:heme-degrading monooxygenase HmoA